MRWLLLKDLQILRRSPLVSTLLVIYPVAIAVLIGFALSRGPEKPRVAFLNQVPAEEGSNLGEGGQFTQDDAKRELCSRLDCVDVDTREEAVAKVEDGDTLAALILPADLIEKIQSLTSLNPEQPVVEVLVNEEDPVKGRLVDDRIRALVTEANLILSQRVSEQAASYVDLLLQGGTFELPIFGGALDILGLERAGQLLEAVRTSLPERSGEREALDRVIRFSNLAADNLDLALPLLGAVAEPIAVEKQIVSGSPPSLDAFAIGVAATVTLMFVTVLLVAGSLALEREENAFSRLTRGLVGRTALLAEKVALGVAASLAVTLLMLAGLTLFVDIEWSRVHLIALAIAAGGAGFAAFGAAIGGAAREVRASSLLAFMVSLPIAFLSLVPSGTVSVTVFDALKVFRALFPFDPALDAMSGALDAGGPDLGLPLLHLAIIAAAYGLLARLSLRRFA
jgi:ABC-2 type transport system permease protein